MTLIYRSDFGPAKLTVSSEGASTVRALNADIQKKWERGSNEFSCVVTQGCMAVLEQSKGKRSLLVSP